MSEEAQWVPAQAERKCSSPARVAGLSYAATAGRTRESPQFASNFFSLPSSFFSLPPAFDDDRANYHGFS